MTPLLLIEPSTARGGPKTAANDETAPKGDGEFAELVDASPKSDEPAPQPTGNEPVAADAAADVLSPDLSLAQPDLPQAPQQTAKNAVAEGPKTVVVVAPDIAKETVQPQMNVPPEKGVAEGDKVLPDKAVLAAKSAVQAIVEGRMPQSQTDAVVKPLPLPTGQASDDPLPRANADILTRRPEVAVPIGPDQPPQVQKPQTPMAAQIIAVPVDPKTEQDADRRTPKTDQVQLSADLIKVQNGPTPPLTTTPVLAAAPTVMLDLQKQATNAPLAEVDALSSLGSGERLGPTATQTATAVTPPTTAHVGQQVAHQIVAGVMQNGGRATEIALNPEELGRVRLSMTAVDSTITLSVLAERPETTDLLRRNIDALAQEFRALGYDNINFSFGGDGAAQAETDEPSGNATLDAEAIDDGVIPTAQQPTSGLDLRL